MKINQHKLETLISLLTDHALLSFEEVKYAAAVLKKDFPFAVQVEIADSIHYHIHVSDIAKLPHERFLEKACVVNNAEGYIKYAFEEGVNFIFSHIQIAQKEKTDHKLAESYLDHIGIDIRSDDKTAYIVFQQIPYVSSKHDYLFTRQGDEKNVVQCCHMQVKEKYWVYPNEKINYEFAFGPLIIHGTGFGIDLRPANPFKAPLEDATACCSSSKPKAKIFIS